MSMYDYDVLIIGGGPAGSKCAIELGNGGKKVGLIERDAVGGVCLNYGCIPSKTYLYLVELLDHIKQAKRHGIEVGEPRVIWEQAKKRKELNVKILGMALTKSIKESGVEMITGEGMLTGEHEVRVGERTLTAEHIVLALGSKSLFLPITPQGKNVISTTEMLDLPEVPQSLTIIGGGVTGVEIASVFGALGTQITIIEKKDTLLPGQDREITALLKTALERKGCTIHLNSTVLSCQDEGDGATTQYASSDGKENTLHTSKALVVIGRAANYDAEAYEKAGLKIDGKKIVVNEKLQTSLPHVYMIGDCVFKNLTAYGAEREGTVVAHHILGKSRRINYSHIPVTVFSHPEVGSLGLTEEQVKKEEIAYEVKRSPYAANAKAVILGEREGLVKIVIEKATQKILGVHMIGFQATDLVHQAFLAVMEGITVQEWQEVFWSHPVISEVLKEALEAETQ